MTAAGKLSVTVDLHPSIHASLTLLANTLAGKHGYPAAMGPAEILAELACRADDGIRRPGAWERSWLSQALDLDELLATERPDPAAPWRSLVEP